MRAINTIFSSDFSNSPKEILLSDKCIKRGLFSKKYLEKLFEKQKNNTSDNSRFLFRLLNVELWFRNFIDN